MKSIPPEQDEADRMSLAARLAILLDAPCEVAWGRASPGKPLSISYEALIGDSWCETNLPFGLFGSKRRLRVFLPRSLRGADDETVRDIAQYVLDRGIEGKAVVTGLLKMKPRGKARRQPRLIYGPQWKGKHHDIWALHVRIGKEYFGAVPNCSLAWEIPRKGGRRLGVYRGTSNGCHVIHINAILDQDCVPEYVVAGVLYHELLHARFHLTGECRSPHDASFRRAERRFRHFVEQREWLREHFGRLRYEWEEKHTTAP